VSDVRIEGLSRYIFSAPSWRRSLVIIVLLGVIIDGASLRTGRGVFLLGTLGYIIPALIAFLATPPLVHLAGKPITPNRSALLAMACTVFGVIISFSPLLFVFPWIFSQLYAISLGLVFAVRLLVLVAIADYRVSRMLVPALSQSLPGLVTGAFFFGMFFVEFAVLMHLLFGAAILVFIWFFERPLRRSHRISALSFLNAFIAHNTDGSKNLEDFFREIGEPVYVPQASIFFRREGLQDITFTVPNLHPGPMGEIGGGNLPSVLHKALGGKTLVAHGCATHDFNLVSESEIDKIIRAVEGAKNNLDFSGEATKSCRFAAGTVKVLAQGFGDTILMVSTRSPEKTEDLDFSIGLAIMTDCRRHFRHVAFVDAHNSMVEISDPVMPATYTAYEYMRAAEDAAEGIGLEYSGPMKVGFSHRRVPFSREQGFGDLGIMVLVVATGGQHTAYVLIDGNNMVSGLREQLRDALADLADDSEIMTTDSHSVNTVTGLNPVGRQVPFEEILPHVREAVELARADCAPAEAAGSTAWCKGVVVFGSHRISQLASTVNTGLVFLGPLGLAILVFAFILSFIAYVVIV
jgi:putative membrane protein